MVAPAAGARLHDLDALRAVAMLLGLVLHTAFYVSPPIEGFWPVYEEWAYRVDAVANPYLYLIMVLHGFRLQVFFLLSGFFTAMLWERRGLRGLTDNRLKRIGLPLLLCVFTIIPLSDYAHSGELDLRRMVLPWLIDFHHTWFLWNLLLMAMGFAGAARLGIRFRSRLWWLLVPLSAVPMYFMNAPVVGADAGTHFVPNPIVLIHYSMFFLFGAFMYQRKIEMRRRWVYALLPALLIAFPAALYFMAPAIADFAQVLDDYDTAVSVATTNAAGWSWAVSGAFQTAFAWLMCAGMIGLFRMVASDNRPWVRYMSDSCYWLYLLHFPAVIGLQRLVVDWPTNAHLKVCMIVVAMTATMLLSYHYLVRYTPIGTLLHGKRFRPHSRPRGGSHSSAPAGDRRVR